MSSRIVTYNKFKFEVWSKSFRMIEPFHSPMFSSFLSLDNNMNLEREINNFIEIMNIGIKIKERYFISTIGE